MAKKPVEDTEKRVGTKVETRRRAIRHGAELDDPPRDLAMRDHEMPLSANGPALPAPTAGEATFAAGISLETRLHDDERLTELTGPNVVPLSDRRYNALWVFQVTDVFAAANNPAVTPAIVGSTRIVAVTTDEDGVELATYRNRSDLLVVRTRTLEELAAGGVPVVKSHLVRRAGGFLDPSNVTELRVETPSHETTTLLKGIVEGNNVTDVSIVPAINDPEKGRIAYLLGQAPAKPNKFEAGAEVRIVAPPGASAKTRLDQKRRFVFTRPVGDLFPQDAPEISELHLEIDLAPASERTLALTYRITRNDDADTGGTPPEANNTPRTKLLSLRSLPAVGGEPLIRAKNVPPIYLLLI